MTYANLAAASMHSCQCSSMV